jgi:putative addiction module component (TIGR02574 family)
MAPSVDISRFSPAEKLRLIEELWDSLRDADVELSREQVAEIQRRLDSTDRDPGSLVSDSDMRSRLGWPK